MSTLYVQNLNKSFSLGLFRKHKQILSDVSFEIESGKTTGFIGVNGSGKTTSLKCILGFITPDSGQIHFFEKKSELGSDVKARIGYLPERPYLYEFLTAQEFLKFHWDLSGGGAGFQEAAAKVLKKVELANVEDRRLRSFSKGMLQRIGMAQALLRDPEFLILDEPMSGLDPDGRLLIKDIIREERGRGRTIFFSSHLLNDMDELCDNLVVIDGGKMIFQGSQKEFTREGKVEESFRALRSRLQKGERA